MLQVRVLSLRPKAGRTHPRSPCFFSVGVAGENLPDFSAGATKSHRLTPSVKLCSVRVLTLLPKLVLDAQKSSLFRKNYPDSIFFCNILYTNRSILIHIHIFSQSTFSTKYFKPHTLIPCVKLSLLHKVVNAAPSALLVERGAGCKITNF